MHREESSTEAWGAEGGEFDLIGFRQVGGPTDGGGGAIVWVIQALLPSNHVAQSLHLFPKAHAQ